jgi:TonB family protein
MPSASRSLILGAALAVLTSTVGRAADGPKLTQQPLSVGAVAALIGHAAEPTAHAQLAEALRDPRPEVRAAAARIIHIAALVPLLPQVAAALSQEQDHNASVEEGRTQAYLLERQAPENTGKDESPTPTPSSAGSFTPASPSDAIVWSVDGFPDGFVEGVLAFTGCDASKSEGFVAAEISYNRDGLPRKVSVLQPSGYPIGDPPACRKAATILLATAIAPRPTLPDLIATVVVLMDHGCLACLAEPAPGPIPRVALGKRVVTEPKKLKDVKPVYPEAAKQDHVQGQVTFQATISPTGCIRSVALSRGVPGLTMSAIRAVSQWRYTPTLLNGSAVPVVMTVTVGFRLGN